MIKLLIKKEEHSVGMHDQMMKKGEYFSMIPQRDGKNIILSGYFLVKKPCLMLGIHGKIQNIF